MIDGNEKISSEWTLNLLIEEILKLKQQIERHDHQISFINEWRYKRTPRLFNIEDDKEND